MVSCLRLQIQDRADRFVVATEVDVVAVHGISDEAEQLVDQTVLLQNRG
ncbi:hypothetical protein SMD44_08913 [Streptomyces alboflavus]|uniref:Uncharacterized protein n=1 Tax=Streptomyces alboflavus TaxID=67267 RepID=A0A1Z1WSK0_9ACTN|nr:hypothetical protein SMD44_08913 [Streptomyces alboflavus]